LKKEIHTSVIDEKSISSSKDFMLKQGFDVYKKSDDGMLKTLSKNSSLPLIHKSHDVSRGQSMMIKPKIIGNDAMKI